MCRSVTERPLRGQLGHRPAGDRRVAGGAGRSPGRRLVSGAAAVKGNRLSRIGIRRTRADVVSASSASVGGRLLCRRSVGGEAGRPRASATRVEMDSAALSAAVGGGRRPAAVCSALCDDPLLCCGQGAWVVKARALGRLGKGPPMQSAETGHGFGQGSVRSVGMPCCQLKEDPAPLSPVPCADGAEQEASQADDEGDRGVRRR
jgi:hypothetical protein